MVDLGLQIHKGQRLTANEIELQEYFASLPALPANSPPLYPPQAIPAQPAADTKVTEHIRQQRTAHHMF
jgi:hypothetical protein